MKKKMSLENRITLAQNNAIDFTHACMTIALHEMFGLGRERLEKVDKRRSEVNGEVLRIMAASGRAHEARQNAEAWLRSRMPQGYGTEVEVLDVPEERELEAYRQHTADVLTEMQKTQIRAQVSRMRVPCTLPLAKDEMDRRIRAVMEQQVPTSWERRRR